MPGVFSILKPAFSGKLAPRPTAVSATQRFIVKDKQTGNVVWEQSHEYRIGFDPNGELIASP
jgi:hypothetical protein